MKQEEKYIKWTQNKLVLVLIGVGVVSWIIGVAMKAPAEPVEIPEPIETIKEVEVEKTVEIEKVVEKCDKEAKWQELKEIDDQIIELSAEAMLIMSDSFYAISEFDLDRVDTNTAKINALAPRMEDLKNKRTKILSELN